MGVTVRVSSSSSAVVVRMRESSFGDCTAADNELCDDTITGVTDTAHDAS